MVLESVVSSNFNPKQLNVGIWGGDIKLKNLKLKKGALDKFRLPIDVIEGSVGSLLLSVPRPVKATLDDIYLLAVPASESKFDLEEDEKRKQASKMEKLKNSELLLSSSASPHPLTTDTEEASKNESFMTAMTNKILDNLQLSIKNVHIRYEDKVSVPGHPFSVGFTLAELSAVSTNENWEESFIVGPKSGVHKLITLNSLAIYFNTDSNSLANLENPEDFHQRFKELIARADSLSSKNQPNLPDHQYVLKPVSGQGKLINRKQPTKDLARIDCELKFSELAFLLDADQYRDALSCLDLFHFYTRHREFLRFRPSDEDFITNRSKALWIFALTATAHEVHDRAYKWSWDCFRRRRDQRKAYVVLYKAAQQGALPLDQCKLSYQDIRFYRSLARSQMRKERIITQQHQEASLKSPASAGWLGWIWNGSQEASKDSEEARSNDGVLGEEERKQLYEAIEWDEREAASSAIDLPREAILFNIQTKLKTGSFTLRSGKEESISGTETDDLPHDIISLIFEGFSANTIQRTDNSELSLKLAGFRVSDGTIKETKHPQIVRVKAGQSRSTTRRNSINLGSSSTDLVSEDVTQAAESNPFLHFNFEHKPLDGRADNAVTLKMRHMEIVYHPGYVEDVYNFFQPPASQLESVGALINVASETLEGIRQGTRAGLEFALQTHKTVDIKVDMNANLVPAESYEAIKAKQNSKYTEEDYAQLESMMYDRFHVELKDTQLILGNTFEQCTSALNFYEGNEEAHLLERISMHFDVFNCIVDNSPNLTRFKIQGSLPQLRVNFSDEKYKIIISTIDVALPNFKGNQASRPQHPKESINQGIQPLTVEDKSNSQYNRRSAFGLTSFFSENLDQGFELSEGESSRDLSHEATRGEAEDDEFFEAPDPSQVEKSVNHFQRKFELQFTVGRLIVSLSKSNQDDGKDQRLVDSILEGFYFGFALRNFDFTADITLSSMYIEDRLSHLDKDSYPAFKKLITSETLEDPAAEKSDLVKFKYSQVQNDHPEFMTVYEGITKSVDAEFSTINVSLELFDWIMSTFTDQSPVKPSRKNDTAAKDGAAQQVDASVPAGSNDKLRVKFRLRAISFLLNDDGLRLATLSLSSADCSVLFNGPSMRIHARLSSLQLRDDTAKSKDSSFRQLVDIQGDDLADFQYETFVPGDHLYPGHDSMIYLRSGSIQLTVMDEILHRILVFFSKFAKMKAVMDAASQVARQQANEFTQKENNMHFDILIRTPIIIFPRLRNSKDCLIAHLGEINASNSFMGTMEKPVVKTEAGLHNIRLTSEFYSDSQCYTEQILGDVNVDVVMASTKLDRSVEPSQVPDTDIVAHMSDVKVNVTQPQYLALMRLATSVPRIFDFSEIEDGAHFEKPLTPPHTFSGSSTPPYSNVPVADLQPEISSSARTIDGKIIPLWTSNEVTFSVTNVTLELMEDGVDSLGSLKNKSLAKFSLNGNRVHYKMQTDGSFSAELSLKALRAIDTRTTKATKFREIIPVAGHDGDQFILSYNQALGQSTIMLELESPKVILSLDYIIAISSFFSGDIQKENNVASDPLQASQKPDLHQKQSTPGTHKKSFESRMVYRLNVNKPKLTIVSDLEKHDSDAVHLDIGKISIAQQETLAVSISDLGMSLANMGERDSGVSFLDKCTMTLAIDQQARNGEPQIWIEAQATPLVFKLSYRDFLIVYSVYSRALDFSQVQGSREAQSKTSSQQDLQASSTVSRNVNGGGKSPIVVEKRLVSQGQSLSFEASLEFFINYFNLFNSQWEPLMESWPASFRVSNQGSPSYTSLSLESKKRLELNITAAFIDMTMTSVDIWGRERENVMHKKRGLTAPYMIKNSTGYLLEVWAESDNELRSGTECVIEDGKVIPWRFEDWKSTRENVSSSSRNTLGLVLQASGWNSLSGISVLKEGDEVYPLRPRRDKVTHRLLCHVEISNNVKIVTFRSTFQVHNCTMLPIEMCVINNRGDEVRAPYKIVPGESCPVPIEAAYHQKIKIRPDGFKFGWCNEALSWKDFVKQPVRTIVCHPLEGQEPSHRFVCATVYDREDGTVRYYPNLTLRLRAPIEVENLLPYDIIYRVHLKEQHFAYSAFLRKGGISPVHIVDPQEFLLLAVEFQDESLKSECRQRTQYAIVNTDNPEDFPIENRLPFYDEDGSLLKLGLHYMQLRHYPQSGGAFRIQVFSPYVIINKTGLDFAIKSKNFFKSAKNVAGQNIYGNPAYRREPRPFLFSHLTEDNKRNRAILRIGDSNWSKPLSFDVVGANQQVTMPTSTKTSNYWVGLSVADGLGNYKLTKVVTIYPRFIIKNESKVSLYLRERVSDQFCLIKPGKRVLLSLFKDSSDPQLVLSFDASSEKNWSKPLRVQNVGKIYVRVLDPTGIETLIHVEILLQGPSIFIRLDINPHKWPFIVRNKSSSTLSFGQTILESTMQNSHGVVRLYQSTPNSEIPYAWDEPAAGPESLIRFILFSNIEASGSSTRSLPPYLLRDVHVFEVGQLKPLRTYKRGHKLAFDVVVEGQAQVVVVSDYNEATNVWKVSEREDSSGQIQRSDTYSSLGDAGFEAATVAPITSFTISVSLEGFGVSIIDSRLRELLYATLRGIDITFLESQLHREYGMIVRWIQLDNQLDNALFPILLKPTDLPKDPKEVDLRPNLQLQANIVKDDEHGVVYIKYATVLLQKMSLEMDESFVIALLGFSKLSGNSWNQTCTNQLTLEPEGIPEPDSEGGGLDLYFELLHLQPFVIVISFERQEIIDVTERTFDSRNPLYFLLNAVTMAIGTINFLGNPAGLFSNVSSGVQDLFYEPFQGVVLHGSGLGVGIARGAASLVKKSAFGVTDSVSKITGSVSKGLSAAALDSSWALERQRRQFRNRNKINGFATGASAFIDSLASGVQGVAMKPIEGAENEGAVGFFKGLGKGLVGAVAKPAVGTFDFLSNVSGGLRNATTVFDPSQGGRTRLPRHISNDGILRPYDAREAQGREWLRTVDNGKFYMSRYVAHVELPNDEDSVCILSTEQITMIRINKMVSVWHVLLVEVEDVKLESSGISLYLMYERGPFVALTNSETRLWFYQNVKRTLKELHDKKNREAGRGHY
ncbi:hypothetical protein BY996DRAFT_6432303 [Phakopsora pachyrhizi]|nr:hypothetical protein BY996DRAFT_6432303 [Phakopsora pachyrhizi]